MVTTIQVKDETLNRLKELKTYSRESYDEIINNLINKTEAEVLTDEDIEAIKEGLEDVKAGRTYPLDVIAKEFGVKLK